MHPSLTINVSISSPIYHCIHISITITIIRKVHVEFVPLGVIGAIVPWNYPFHNVFNPVSAALFSGNSIVIKVSEYASWSIDYYKRIIDGNNHCHCHCPCLHPLSSPYLTLCPHPHPHPVVITAM